MERKRKKERIVGIIVVVAICITTIVISVLTSQYITKKDFTDVLQGYQEDDISDKLLEIRKFSEYKGDVQEVKDLYLKGLLTDKEANQEFREILLKAEEMYYGFTYSVKFDIDHWDGDGGPDSEVTANIISNELDDLIRDLIDEIFETKDS